MARFSGPHDTDTQVRARPVIGWFILMVGGGRTDRRLMHIGEFVGVEYPYPINWRDP